MLAWYARRFSVLFDLWTDIRILMKLREHSGPAETLKMIQERLAEARHSYERLDQTDEELKELKDDEENS